MSDTEELTIGVASTLALAYGLQPAEVTQIPAGTATVNYRVTDRMGGEWFAKVYCGRTTLPRDRAAVELAEFARAGHLPVPAVRRTREGDLIEEIGELAMSLWEYVPDAETAEGGLTAKRWPAVGTLLGRLHRRLADHPAAAPALRPATGVCDLERARSRHDRLITEYFSRSRLGPFETWALEAVRQRLALLDRVAVILAELPELTEQIVHGDLASPNLLLRGDQVAAVVDFQPPRPRYAAWEIARIACDPRTILLGDQWLTGLPVLLAAYRDEHPTARVEDLVATVAVGCAYTLASTYPLAEPLDNPGAVDAALETYGRARHEAALVLLDRLDDAGEALRDSVR
jgi:Ser/Thr protein kinase RdoA (MazF antagonist)